MAETGAASSLSPSLAMSSMVAVPERETLDEHQDVPSSDTVPMELALACWQRRRNRDPNSAPNALADVLEAMIAAVFLDSGGAFPSSMRCSCPC
jgi:dsRNA-specific ribonuclease